MIFQITNELLYKFHYKNKLRNEIDNIYNCDSKKIVNLFNENSIFNKKIYYKGIIKDLQFVINNCAICKIKNSKLDLKKKENYKIIIFHKPNDRYITDLAYIPNEFNNNTNNYYYIINSKYKYIVRNVDHFLYL